MHQQNVTNLNLKFQETWLQEKDKLASQHESQLQQQEQTFQNSQNQLKFEQKLESENLQNKIKILNDKLVNYDLLEKSETDLLKKFKILQSDLVAINESHRLEIENYEKVIASSNDILEQAEDKIVKISENFERKKAKILADSADKMAEKDKILASLETKISNLEEQVAIYKDFETKYLTATQTIASQNKTIQKNDFKLENYIERDKISASNFSKILTEKERLELDLENVEQKLESEKMEVRTLKNTIVKMQEIMIRVGACKVGNLEGDMLPNLLAIENIVNDNDLLRLEPPAWRVFESF